jgi:hypothetical protein
MGAICSSEMSVETQQTTWRHIPEDDTLPDIGTLQRSFSRYSINEIMKRGEQLIRVMCL